MYRKTVDHVWHKTMFIRYPGMYIGGLVSLERKFQHIFCEKYFEIIKSNFGDITHCNIRVLAPASHKTMWKRLFKVQVVSMGTNVSKPMVDYYPLISPSISPTMYMYMYIDVCVCVCVRVCVRVCVWIWIGGLQQ